MKMKLVLSTQNEDREFWMKLHFTPRKNEWFNVKDFLDPMEVSEIRNTAQCWTSDIGVVQSVEYRKKLKNQYVEIYIWCED
jgi:hypothetical protein